MFYTIGYGNLNIDVFCERVKKKGNMVIDVRRYPNAGRLEYKVNRLCEKLVSWEIDYLWMGDVLGGKLFYPAKDHNFNVIPLLVRTRKGVLMCCEASPMECHRTLIAEDLKRFHIEVMHIDRSEKAIRHDDLDWDYRKIKPILKERQK